MEHRTPDCETIREALSARLDHEEPGIATAALDDHLSTCQPCSRWLAAATTLHRAARVRAAEPVPDLSAAIVGASIGAGGSRRSWARVLQGHVSTVRWALLTVALTQLVLAAPALLLGEDAGATVHVARELGSFDVALAVGLLVAALQPARAWGLLPVAVALGVVLAGTAVLDVVDGRASTLGEAHHVLDVAGLALLWLVARDTRAPAATPSPRRWMAA